MAVENRKNFEISYHHLHYACITTADDISTETHIFDHVQHAYDKTASSHVGRLLPALEHRTGSADDF